MRLDTLLRRAEHQVLSQVELHGRVLDLGGDRRSKYLQLLKGSPEFTLMNFNPKATPDLVHDLEKPLPIEDTTFDAVLLINVLEHIFNYKQLLAESARVLKPEGSVVIVVPFLFPTHPSPHDHWRFTGETLTRLLADAGFRDTSVTPLGSGVFSAQYLFIDRLMPSPIRFFCYYSCRYVALALDAVFTTAARVLGKKYNPADYALGYMVTATK